MLNLSKLLIFIMLVPNIALANNVSLGGMFVKGGTANFNLALDFKEEVGKWQTEVEGNYFWSEKNNVELRNEGLFNVKRIYTFADKHYVIGNVGYNFDDYREVNTRKTYGAGYGYKILRTEKFKASNEITFLNLNTDLGNELIWRNSLWFFFKIDDQLSFTNKYLIETGDIEYVRNETYFNYQLTEKLKLSLGNVYTEDPVSDNVTTINFNFAL
jgi:putative salt-induced outer membrane protein YdiY